MIFAGELTKRLANLLRLGPELFDQVFARVLGMDGGLVALILAGALGNLYDRMNYGYVVDFLESLRTALAPHRVDADAIDRFQRGDCAWCDAAALHLVV